MKVGLVIGQDSAPGWSVRMTPMPGADAQSALAAAAWKASLTRRDRLAVLVDQVGVGQLVLLGVGVFDVADRALRLHHVVGDAFVALGADAGRELDRRVRADLRLEVGADLREVVRPDERRARAVRAIDDGDGVGRKLHARG